jgi:hypothetical protein
MPQTYLEIRTRGENIWAAGATTPPDAVNRLRRGDVATVALRFPRTARTISTDTTVATSAQLVADTLTVESGTTLTIDSGGVVIVYDTLDNNGTVDTDGTLVVVDDSLPRALDFGQFAGSFTTRRLRAGEIRYHERVPSSAAVDSVLVGINPAPDLTEVRGVWGLVSDVRDRRNTTLQRPVVQLEVTVLADFDDFADLNAVKDTFEV